MQNVRQSHCFVGESSHIKSTERKGGGVTVRAAGAKVVLAPSHCRKLAQGRCQICLWRNQSSFEREKTKGKNGERDRGNPSAKEEVFFGS